MKFSDFGLAPPIIEGLEAIGFDTPTPVQQLAVPAIMQGHDIIACAQTGTGKTAAFLLPIIHGILKRPETSLGIKALILAPTRELAIQIDQQLEGLAYFANISSIAVFGGGSGALFDQEKKALQKGADIVVATPGRFISHLNLGYVDLSELQYLVIDEADRMLDMGFLPNINLIINHLPTDRQSLLFSATMPDGIRKLASGILRNPVHINLSVSKPAENVKQSAYLLHESQKIPLVEHLLSGDSYPLVIVFAGTKQMVKETEKTLKAKGISVRAIHSDLSQEERNEVMQLFRAGQIQVLVATDIASRGIDVDNISLVINFNVPADAEDYVHRVGRTARAEREGEAITLVSQNEFGKFRRIEQLLGIVVDKRELPSELGKGQPLSSYENPRKQTNKNKRGEKKLVGKRGESQNNLPKAAAQKPEVKSKTMSAMDPANNMAIRAKNKQRRRPPRQGRANQKTP